jgi:hypothetical protein
MLYISYNLQDLISLAFDVCIYISRPDENKFNSKLLKYFRKKNKPFDLQAWPSIAYKLLFLYTP